MLRYFDIILLSLFVDACILYIFCLFLCGYPDMLHYWSCRSIYLTPSHYGLLNLKMSRWTKISVNVWSEVLVTGVPSFSSRLSKGQADACIICYHWADICFSHGFVLSVLKLNFCYWRVGKCYVVFVVQLTFWFKDATGFSDSLFCIWLITSAGLIIYNRVIRFTDTSVP